MLAWPGPMGAGGMACWPVKVAMARRFARFLNRPRPWDANGGWLASVHWRFMGGQAGRAVCPHKLEACSPIADLKLIRVPLSARGTSDAR